MLILFYYINQFWLEEQTLVSIPSTFYEKLLRQYSFAKKLQSQTVIREKPLEAYKKFQRKMLMKLTPV